MLTLPQAIVVRTYAGPRLVASSPGFPFAHEEAVLRVAVRFGSRPAGVACPAAVFACLLDARTVAVVQVADRPDESLDPPLAFRFILFDRATYPGDPFRVADRFQPYWSAPSPLSELEWPTEFQPRTVEQVRAVLKSGDGPLLLGAAQGLVDGGHVAVTRAAPDPKFVRGLWQLLPDRVRAELWPATFAFSAELGFHAVVLPAAPPDGYMTEDRARDYPEGRYELSLQVAAESGDQAELDRLFARRTSSEVLRMAVAMVAFALLLAAAMKFL
jgi:hypothetical protein